MNAERLPTRAHALDLAAKGWRVLRLDGKVPSTRHGVLDATTDPDQIHQWWADGHGHNIGARVPDWGVVLDVDPRNGGSWEALEELAGIKLPDTLTVHSGRGDGGQHRYYLRPPGTLSSRRLPPGIDVKTDTGYCVVPPSVHPASGQPYRWEQRPPVALPEPVRLLLTQPYPLPPQRPARAARMYPDATLSVRAMHLVRHVESAAEGQRNDRLFWAVCEAHRCGYSGDTFDLLEGAAIVAGLSELEAARTVASAHRRMGGAQ